MARYKYIDTAPRFLPVDLARQLLPGTFEHAVHHLLEHTIDLSAFDARFRNDTTGAPAYPPAMLLQVVLVGYAHGVVSSRGIEQLCREHVTFIALCGDTAPHFTTIAHFVSTLGEDIARVFAAVVAVCDAQGLISREMFAIDGVKLPSNAAKGRSGTRADFERQATKLEATARTLVERHRAADALPVESPLAAKAAKRIERLERDAEQLRAWLAAHAEDRRGPKGGVRQSNRTDNESAKMATGKGVIQGYTGVAAVDGAHQIIVEAQAHGTGAEQEVLMPMVTAMDRVLAPHSVVTADAGYHSEGNLAQLAAMPVDALIADGDMRRRDERFATQDRHREKPNPLHDKSPASRALPLYQPRDFTYDPVARTCVCPAGKSLYRTGRALVTKGHIGDRFRGAKRDCVPCPVRARCLRTPEATQVRQVAFFHGKTATAAPTHPHTARMKARIDSPEGRARYNERFGTVEPVFANLCYNKGLARFTLRGRTKVDGQWKLFCLVHNIEKLAHHGYAA
ncbi:MAG: IS1182 family transposase [Gemmatimonadota bacterium]|nr:IS1182 family transposase [Gemmatimonadota bacterium]